MIEEEQAPERPDGAVIVLKTYDCVLWLLPKLEKLPRSYRITLGNRLVETGLDVLVNVTEAAYTHEKGQLLRVASRKLNLTRTPLRLAKDPKLVSESSYHIATEQVDEIGRMLGGWMRSLRPRGATA